MVKWETLRREVEAWVENFPNQTYLLYAMGLRLGTMDYDKLQTDHLLDGPDDKKVDFYHLDLESGVATIAQGYQSNDWTRSTPPANKASDLNTAVNWLLESNLEDIPRPAVKASAEELRDNLRNGDITTVEIFYVHNLPNSDNVEQELGTAQRALQRLLEQYGDNPDVYPTGIVRQAGREVVEEWRGSQHEAVSIEDDVILTSTVPPQTISTAASWARVPRNHS